MAEPINLNRFRKDKARRDARSAADANAAKFGRSKAERTADAAAEARRQALLDGHQRDANGDEDA
ncbi:DUF4169 family protein [Frigidibacter sp. MR17.14]|uniref:DUF4169 family protein n=1 Tax=Frigidibacter sp. MR17.14 TaxID=3126509 RepID=UPI003012E362